MSVMFATTKDVLSQCLIDDVNYYCSIMAYSQAYVHTLFWRNTNYNYITLQFHNKICSKCDYYNSFIISRMLLLCLKIYIRDLEYLIDVFFPIETERDSLSKNFSGDENCYGFKCLTQKVLLISPFVLYLSKLF
jgi:hypothetical protein